VTCGKSLGKSAASLGQTTASRSRRGGTTPGLGPGPHSVGGGRSNRRPSLIGPTGRAGSLLSRGSARRERRLKTSLSPRSVTRAYGRMRWRLWLQPCRRASSRVRRAHPPKATHVMGPSPRTRSRREAGCSPARRCTARPGQSSERFCDSSRVGRLPPDQPPGPMSACRRCHRPPPWDSPAILHWGANPRGRRGRRVSCPDGLTLREQRAIRAEKGRVIRRLTAASKPGRYTPAIRATGQLISTSVRLRVR
jgi:hypothetical protein